MMHSTSAVMAPVVLLADGHGALGAARALGRRGVEVTAVCTGEPRPVRTEVAKATGRPSFSPWGPRIVLAGTGTLASPRQVAGLLRLAASESLLMLLKS